MRSTVKFLMATLAVALPLFAFADEMAKPAVGVPQVTLYGMINANLQQTKADGLTPATNVVDRLFLSTDSSNIGVRASVGLFGDDLKGVAQCESSADIAGITGNTPTKGLCNRNSRIGIQYAPLGTFFYGVWDTPFKAAIYGTKADDPFWDTDVFDFGNIMQSPGFQTANSTTPLSFPTAGLKTWEIRATNSVAFHSANWAGLSFKVQYSANGYTGAHAGQDPDIYGAVLNYDNGPFSASAAFERHDDYYGLAAINGSKGANFGSAAANALSVGSHDQAWQLAAGYELPTHTTIAAVVNDLYYNQGGAVGSVEQYTRFAWHVSVAQRLGQNEFKARFDDASADTCSLRGGGACNAKDYGAWNLVLGYTYWFNNAFQAYLYWTLIHNEQNAQYTFATGGDGIVTPVAKGADPEAGGLGFRFRF
jgi:predicted porin